MISNLFLSLALTLSLSQTFAADNIESMNISDLPSLQNCYRSQPYILKETHGTKQTEVYVDNAGIQARCTEKAVLLAKTSKSPMPTQLSIAEEVRKNVSPEESLKIFKVIIENDKSLKACDEMSLFKALQSGLSHPKNYPNESNSYFLASSQIIKSCSKNSQFLSDMKEESESTNQYVSTNLCTIFKEQKIQSKCK
jgi:hypothetical protein